ncbi:CHAT domain protein [Ceratobasidium sp. AG-Ba]|nr:CHAT domain protein [Ceratobasidium sp. AG-Ba]
MSIQHPLKSPTTLDEVKVSQTSIVTAESDLSSILSTTIPNGLPWTDIGIKETPIREFPQYLKDLGEAKAAQINIQDIPADLRIPSSELESMKNNFIIPLIEKHHSSGPCSREEMDTLVWIQTGAAGMVRDQNPQKPSLLEDLAGSVLRRSERLEDLSDTDLAIDYYIQSLSLTPADSPEKSSRLEGLARAYQHRFQMMKRVEDIDQAIALYEQVITMSADETGDASRLFRNISILYNARFGVSENIADIDRALEYRTQAFAIKTNSGNEGYGELSQMAGFLLVRFKQLGKTSDIDQAVSWCEQIISAVPRDHPDLHQYCHNFSIILQARFDAISDYADLDKAIQMCRAALSILPQDDTHKSWYLQRFIPLLRTRINRALQQEDVEEAIVACRIALEIDTQDHSMRQHLRNQLGIFLRLRFSYTGAAHDIDQSILVYRQALSAYLDHAEVDKDTRDLLTNFGIALTCRYEHFGQHLDIEQAIDYHSQALRLSDSEDSLWPSRLSELASSFTARFQLTGQIEDISNAISYLRDAIGSESESENTPEDSSRHQLLAVSLVIRFEATKNMADINEAIKVYRRAIPRLPDNHSEKPVLLNGIGNALNLRFTHVENVVDIDEAIAFHIQSVVLTPESHSKWATRRVNVGTALMTRYMHLGQIQDLKKAIEYQEQGLARTPDAYSAKRTLSLALGNGLLTLSNHSGTLEDATKAINCFNNALYLAGDDRMLKIRAYSGLAQSLATRFQLLHEQQDIDQAIGYGTQALDILPENHSKSTIQLYLSQMHSLRFRYAQAASDVDLAVNYAGEALRSVSGDIVDSQTLLRYANCLLLRFTHLHEPQDLALAVTYYQRTAELSTGSIQDRFQAACKWARLAVSDPLKAFGTAIDLLLRNLWVGVSVQRRYEIISSSENIVVDAAAAAIKSGQFELAIEWLEAGRSVIWQQHLNFRLPLDELRLRSPELAERLENIAHHLDRVDVPQFSDLDFDNPQGSERLSQRHRQYANEWQHVVDEARLLPGLSDFMRPAKASRLLKAAKSGPVVLINVSSLSCDALVLLPDRDDFGHVPLPEFSLELAQQSRSSLAHLLHSYGLTTRGVRTGVTRSEVVYGNMLALLWRAVVKPVFDYIGLMSPVPRDQRPHVTWCATGPISSLPLHAAGLYDEPEVRAFNYAIFSYVPTLSALIRAQETGDEFNGILAVGQTHTAGENFLPGTVEELARLRKHTSGLRFTQLDEFNASADQVLSSMQTHSWVHLACHAAQNLVEPTKSAFLLHDSTLDLATIMSQPIGKGGLAYLSACQTATGDENMPEEAVHLAAGMLMAGYSSVIATMWSIHDIDAPLVADTVYAELMEGGVPDRSRAAKALHFAVEKLRDHVGETQFVRWVPYIHIGA